MISPINNITFGAIKKVKKINKNNPQSQPIQNSKVINSSSLNFTGYLSQKPKVTLEYGIENNFFKLPKTTLEDGTLIQIQPDKSQIECAKKLCDGKNVLFDAPTGMGKTSVAHFAINKNLAEGKKTIYTVPIKALANDKYVEFSKIYGKNNVGILTGDRKINPFAPIVIETTEIFNNQAQAMTLNDAMKTGTVVYDEGHYLGDVERGIAWEQSMISAASKGVQILTLSATIGNADEITSWIGKIEGARPSVRVSVPSNERPVPLLWKLYRHDSKVGDRLSPVVYGEIDLTKNMEDSSWDVIDLIYKIEMDYYERRHKTNENEPDYDGRFLKDSNYRAQIPEKLEKALGEDWINADFSDKETYLKLKKEFESLAPTDMENISKLACASGANSLSDRQKEALELIFKRAYGCTQNHKMTNGDYEFVYSQLKMAIGEGQNNFKYDTEAFKKRLARSFGLFDMAELDFISQALAKADVKSINAIHEDWRDENISCLIKKLNEKDMLPAIIFKLTQKGCEDAAQSLLISNSEEDEIDEFDEENQELDLLTPEEKEQVQEIINKYEQNGVYLGLNINKNLLLRGIGIHHAGRLPQYKKLVEELFSKKLMKVVFATSTLGAGINMPARTVVMTNTAYQKYDPDTKEVIIEPLTSNEFHQMAGRAGRRGIDKVGNVVLYNLHTPYQKFNKEERKDKTENVDELWHAYKLMDSPADNLRSSFRPQSVMLANYYSKESSSEGLWKLIKQTFKVHSAKDKDKVDSQMHKKFESYTQVLLKQGYLMKNHKKELVLTPKGEILTQCQGMDPLMLSSLLYDEKLAKMSPVQLAQIAAHIQGSSEQTESIELRALVTNKLNYIQKETQQTVSMFEFEQTLGMYEALQAKIIRTLSEQRVSHLDIKHTDSISGLIGYLFASFNSMYPDESINNFEQIVKTNRIASHNDAKIDNRYAAKTSEGNVYKIIAGTISTLKQMIRICDFALDREEYFPNVEYWEIVKENARKAVELLDKEPINNDPEYANYI